MNEYSQSGLGKISVHGDGMGVPTPELIEKRAREIALIDERNPEEFSDTDWDQAVQELTGAQTTAAPEDVDHAVENVTSWDEAPGVTGERARRAGVEDDENIGEQLVTGGLEEAEHDTMVQARREELRQEGGVIEGA